MPLTKRALFLAVIAAPLLVTTLTARSAEPPWQAFLAAGDLDKARSTAALDEIAAHWEDRFAGMIVDVARFLPSPRRPGEPDPSGSPFEGTEFGDETPQGQPAHGRDFPVVRRPAPGADVRRRLTSFLEKQTGQRLGDDLRAWRRWIWSRPAVPHSGIARFKAELYARIDPRFRQFFPETARAEIRYDEIDWGGVKVNGIPPLRTPRHIPASAATYLRDGHIVFGIEVNGEARAYPKRILAWHEMATDRLGGVDLAIVYCTLCGTVIPYESRVAGRAFTFGTSGLLYRSNKLMFDEETMSLWSTLDGAPVVGRLVGSGLRMAFRSVVTTTWGEWKRDHPATTVLSLDTGYERNYAEGAAYREYFATDRKMFETPVHDTRLKNKAEVLVLRSEVLGPGAAPVALAVERLKRERLFAVEAGTRRLLIVTSKDGANRVYDRGPYDFTAGPREGLLRDATGSLWKVTPVALLREDGAARRETVPAHRAFWFGWVAQFPKTVLVK